MTVTDRTLLAKKLFQRVGPGAENTGRGHPALPDVPAGCADVMGRHAGSRGRRGGQELIPVGR
eukprot:6277832-Heterocapsa_arctica.AAC.1